MASGSVGDNNGKRDLSGVGPLARPRLGEFTKVYTRKFRRRRPVFNRDAAEPPPPPPHLAVASTDAAGPSSSASPFKSRICNDDDVAQPSLQEAPAAQDGNFSQQLEEKEKQPQPSGSDLCLSEEGKGEGEDVRKGDGEKLQSCDQEALVQLQQSDGQEKETAPNGEEEPTRSSGDQEAVSNSNEVPQPTGVQEATSNREENVQPIGIQAATSNSVDERQLLPNGYDQPQLSGDEVPHSVESDMPMNDGSLAALENGEKPLVTRVEDRIRINLSESTSKDVIRGVKRKLVGELDQVRSLVRKLEAKEFQFTAYNTINTNNGASYVGGLGSYGAHSQPQLMRVHSNVGSGVRPQLMRVSSEVGSVGRQESRPFRHLTVSVMHNNHGVGEFVEREKRTPKANQYYRNSEFLLGKDRLPPEKNKRFKANGAGRRHGGEAEYGFGFGIGVAKNRDKVFKSCSNLLQRLMKHKHGWVFNEPVDAEKLCITDYHDIIKHPMDFGTIKSRLSQNFYKSPRGFAEDVRLVFRNAMTYNPKGQDVHRMAEELSDIFEEKWASIEKEYFPSQMYYDVGLPIPTPRRLPYPLPTSVLSPVTAPLRSAPLMRTLDRSESMTMSVDSRPKPNFPPIRTPVPKKPKAKDPNKRDMTYEEKQKLSTKLQSLPTEKLDAIVQIIKRRNTAMSQHDDEIEVDIDNVDAETLWELDRFVTNYKKSLSKNKRRAELAQARAEAAQAVSIRNTAPAVRSAQKESGGGENTNHSTVQVEKQGDNVSASSSSSSSSSDSGSSSSDSDSDSSSADGSDAGRSPRI